MNVLSDGSLSLVSIIKKIKADKKFLFEEGNPYFFYSAKDKNCFYLICYTPKDQKELEIKEGIPYHVYKAGRIPMFYTIMVGYKPHRQIIDNVVRNMVANYYSNFNFNLRALNYIKEVSFFLSKDILGKKGLTYAVLSFVLKTGNGDEPIITIIEPDGGVTEDVPFFVGGMLDREIVEEIIRKKETTKEKLISAYHEVFVRTNDAEGIMVLEISTIKGQVRRISKEDLDKLE